MALTFCVGMHLHAGRDLQSRPKRYAIAVATDAAKINRPFQIHVPARTFAPTLRIEQADTVRFDYLGGFLQRCSFSVIQVGM